MAPRKSPTKKPQRKTKAKASPEMEEVWQCTHNSVKALINTLAKGVDSPTTMPEHWERLFGTKDSAVANLQKLVALLVELRQHFHESVEDDAVQEMRMELHELDMLEAWLAKQKTTGDV